MVASDENVDYTTTELFILVINQLDAQHFLQ